MGRPGGDRQLPVALDAAVFADLQHGTAKFTGPQPMIAYATPSIELPAVDTPDERRIAEHDRRSPAAVTVHVVGVTLGLAVWTAFDHGNAVSDLVPTYRFRARVDNGDPYDIVVLALDPARPRSPSPVRRPRPSRRQPHPRPQPRTRPRPRSRRRRRSHEHSSTRPPTRGGFGPERKQRSGGERRASSDTRESSRVSGCVARTHPPGRCRSGRR